MIAKIPDALVVDVAGAYIKSKSRAALSIEAKRAVAELKAAGVEVGQIKTPPGETLTLLEAISAPDLESEQQTSIEDISQKSTSLHNPSTDELQTISIFLSDNHSNMTSNISTSFLSDVTNTSTEVHLPDISSSAGAYSSQRNSSYSAITVSSKSFYNPRRRTSRRHVPESTTTSVHNFLII